jgi:hypothetical protein
MRALSRGLMVLGVIGIAVAGGCGGNEGVKKEIIVQERTTKEIAPLATSINKVVIGVLDFDTIGTWGSWRTGGGKNSLMHELKRNTRVKLVDIRESSSLSDLKRNGYEGAERYKNIYQLDMLLYVHMSHISFPDHWVFNVNLIDLYTRKVKEVSIETQGVSVDLAFRGVSRKILVSQDLNRVLSVK